MGTIQTTQPGGAGTFTGSGTCTAGGRIYFAYLSATTSWTWTLLSKPGGSTATLTTQGAASYFSPDLTGDYGIRFTDNAAANTDVTITVQTGVLTDPSVSDFNGSGLGISVKSLIPPHLRFSGFRNTVSGTLLMHDRQDTVDVLLDAMVLNIAGNQAANGEVTYLFSCPPNCIGGTFSIRAKMFTGSANNTCRIRIGDSNYVSMKEVQCSVTATPQTFSVTVPNGLDSTNYFSIGIAINDLNQQCKLAVGAIKFEPIFSSAGPGPTFVGNFIRLHVQQQVLSNNQLAGVVVGSGVAINSNPYSEIILDTDAKSIAYEMFAGSPDGQAYILYGELPYAAPTAVASAKVQIRDTVLPVPPAGRVPRVALRNGIGIGPITTIGSVPSLSIIRAVYLPEGCRASLAPPPPYEGVFVGDSIANGELTSLPGFMSYVMILRQWYGAITHETYSGQALYDAIGPTATDTVKQKAYAHYLLRKKPRDLFFNWIINDWARGQTDATWTAALYQTALQNFLTQCVAYSPETRYWLLGTGITTQEGANAAGSTKINYNTSMAAVATALGAPQFTYVDMRAAGFHLVGDLADAVHPNQLGHGRDAAALISVLQASGVFAV